jgi:MFS family permease
MSTNRFLASKKPDLLMHSKRLWPMRPSFSPDSAIYPYLMWLIPVFFFFQQFIVRVMPSLMLGPLMEQFGVNEEQMGIISACYYLGYAGMQLPMAALLEKYQPRMVLAGSIFVYAGAFLLFSHTTNYVSACFFRMLIGAGSSAAFLGSARIAEQWFTDRAFGRMLGLTITLGLMGAMASERIVNGLGPWTTWVLAGLGFACAALAALVLKPGPYSHQSGKGQPSQHLRLSDIFKLIQRRPLWILAAVNLLMMGTLGGFSDTWGKKYLESSFASPVLGADILFPAIFLGLIISGALVPWLSQRIGNRTLIASCGMIIALIFVLMTNAPFFTDQSVVVSLWNSLPLWLHKGIAWLAFAALGVCSGYQIAVLTLGAESTPMQMRNVSVAFLNCVNMAGGAVFNSLIGAVLHQAQDQWHMPLKDAYWWAILPIPMTAILSSLLILFWRSENPTTPSNQTS